MAERQGLALHKSRRRDPRALDYGAYWLANRGDDHVRVDVPGTDLDAIERFLMWEVE